MEIYDFNGNLPDIDLLSPSLTEHLKRHYADKVIVPRSPHDVFLRDLCEYFDLEKATYETLEWLTVATLDCSSYRRENTSVWRFASERNASRFFRYFRDRFWGEPKLCIVYDRTQDLFFSNCSLLEIYMVILRGVEESDVACDTKDYRWYLNLMYAYDSEVAVMESRVK